MGAQQSIQILNDRDKIDGVRKFFDQFGEENGLSEKVTHDIQMALDELLTNIVNYGYEDEGEHFIDVHFEVDKENLKVEIVDDAKSYNMLEREDPDTTLSVEDKPIGGLGVYLVKKLMSHVEYYTEGDKNHFIMIKGLE
jgi:anti-sigma regulatory factor (Ser/Thr protein kinase)